MLANKGAQFFQTVLVDPVPGQFPVLKVRSLDELEGVGKDHNILNAQLSRLPQDMSHFRPGATGNLQRLPVFPSGKTHVLVGQYGKFHYTVN